MRNKILKSRFISPYDKDGNSNITFAKGKPEVYMIKEKGADKFSYIGYSGSNLQKTCLRHFQ